MTEKGSGSQSSWGMVELGGGVSVLPGAEGEVGLKER